MMANDQGLRTESFSSSYEMVPDATVETWQDEEAHMDFRLYRTLARRFGEPVIGFIGGLHYQFKPSDQVLSGRCAVPAANHSDPSVLLIRK